MTPAIQSLISACEWSTSQFLVISENVFSPLLYYSYFGSIIPSLLIAFFVFFKGPKKLPNRLLLLTVLSFTAWVLCAMVTWATEFPSYTMFFWSTLNIFEPLVYFFAFYFFYVFIFEKDLSTNQKVFLGLPLLVTLILTPTRFGLLGYNLTDCERNAIEGIVATYGYIIEIGYVFLILGFAFYFINKTKSVVERKKAILLTTGIIAFLLSFSSGNILEVFTENWYIGQYGLFGAPIFVGFLAFIMVKYKSFNTKIFGAQVLVFTIGILIVSMFFVRKIENLRYVLVGTVVLFLPFGRQLIRSVKQEIEGRKKVEKLAGELAMSNEGQKNLIHIMNHQIKGFLGVAKNIFAELLGTDYGVMPEPAKPLLTHGFEQMGAGVEYVQGILRGASAQSGVLPYSMKPVDLMPIVTELITEQKDVAEKRELSFASNITPGDYKIVGDGVQLKEAFKNLITNAIKYNSPKGSVKVNFEKEYGKIIFSVKDTGVGITEEDKQRLFTAGGVGKNSIKLNTDAAGYGLSFVKGVAEAHKGKVGYRSNTPEKGTTFFIELPLK